MKNRYKLETKEGNEKYKVTEIIQTQNQVRQVSSTLCLQKKRNEGMCAERRFKGENWV